MRWFKESQMDAGAVKAILDRYRGDIETVRNELERNVKNYCEILSAINIQFMDEWYETVWSQLCGESYPVDSSVPNQEIINDENENI